MGFWIVLVLAVLFGIVLEVIDICARQRLYARVSELIDTIRYFRDLK